MPTSQPPPGFLRRLAAIVYDFLLLLAVWFIAFSLATLATKLVTGSDTISSEKLAFVYLELVTFLFFGWFWTHGGQTLGMRAWRLRLVTRDGQPIRWNHAIVRYAYAQLSWLAFGLGFIWILFDKQKHAWHDDLSKTYMRLVEKPKKK
jgi:uncharacterized RDD family membrane protein YckC